MVECEFEALDRFYSGIRVLIDTWWNVNTTQFSPRLRLNVF